MAIPADAGRVGFTLVELLVVILIIGIVSAVALPTIIPALSHRQVSEAARLVQGAIAGARDKAIRTNQPSGIRLLPDPALLSYQTISTNPYFGQVDASQILACNRIIPIDPAPEYSEGLISIFLEQGGFTYPAAIHNPSGAVTPIPTLVLEESIGKWIQIGTGGTYTFMPNPPTNWFWNIRIGDKIQINNSGPWYTVVGPMVIPPKGTMINGTFYSNPEMFANTGPPGTASPWSRTYTSGAGDQTTLAIEYLLLVNGQDDDGNGWIDEGFDGVDNDGMNGIDDTVVNAKGWPGEWEAESWGGSLGASNLLNAAYTIKRRPLPSPNAREIALPSGVVIDLTGWGSFLNGSNQLVPASLERSRIPGAMFNPDTGYVDIVINPDGTVLPTTVYSSPSSFNMGSTFVHLWLAERGDLAAPSQTQTGNPYLPVPQGLARDLPSGPLFSGQELKGEYALVTLFTRTGQVLSSRTMPFLYNAAEGGFTNNPGNSTNPLAFYNSNYPYAQAQQGVGSQ